MSIQIDVTHALRRPGELVRLVEAIVNANSEDEAEWVEWKSSLPLEKARGRFAIAKQIIGFANRDPDRAARFAEGNGYLIVGAAPGEVLGVARVDGARLDDGLDPYLGGDGPAWSATYVTLQGKDVLVITVEAPKDGHAIHALQKTYGTQRPTTPGAEVEKGADEGTVFVRAGARTRPANAADLKMLQQRLLRGRRQPRLDLVLGWTDEPVPLTVLNCDPEVRQQWRAARRQALLAALPDSPADRAAASVDAVAGLHASILRASGFEDRTPEQYLDEVDRHLADANQQLEQACVAAMVQSGRNEVRLSVTNPPRRNLPSARITLRLPGEVLAVAEDLDDRMPEPPRPYGSKQLPGSLLGTDWVRALVRPEFVPSLPLDVHVEHRGGVTTLSFDVGDLHPCDTVELDAFHLILREPLPGRVVRGTWTATSTGVDDLQEDTFEFPVAEVTLTPFDLIPPGVEAAADVSEDSV